MAWEHYLPIKKTGLGSINSRALVYCCVVKKCLCFNQIVAGHFFRLREVHNLED